MDEFAKAVSLALENTHRAVRQAAGLGEKSVLLAKGSKIKKCERKEMGDQGRSDVSVIFSLIFPLSLLWSCFFSGPISSPTAAKI